MIKFLSGDYFVLSALLAQDKNLDIIINSVLKTEIDLENTSILVLTSDEDLKLYNNYLDKESIVEVRKGRVDDG
ncbi:hypothetical protein [Halanaerobium praevalens]|uniref:Fructose-1-phosphate kinase n=1 Tax=Halanaerobium praevalens (strain ATCC 33744 / DSM 2228 / GSL) TaxID=572479 RepID=E3DNG3_HALPG|nr:hypothetical protein [Halanaerobium praevalens]ADO76501.1 fructose-1-phosphate kinase [Halanaerobium praevalens DSM 2228]